VEVTERRGRSRAVVPRRSLKTLLFISWRISTDEVFRFCYPDSHARSVHDQNKILTWNWCGCHVHDDASVGGGARVKNSYSHSLSDSRRVALISSYISLPSSNTRLNLIIHSPKLHSRWDFES
jgi:hypothetical protein